MAAKAGNVRPNKKMGKMTCQTGDFIEKPDQMTAQKMTAGTKEYNMRRGMIWLFQKTKKEEVL